MFFSDPFTQSKRIRHWIKGNIASGGESDTSGIDDIPSCSCLRRILARHRRRQSHGSVAAKRKKKYSALSVFLCAFYDDAQ